MKTTKIFIFTYILTCSFQLLSNPKDIWRIIFLTEYQKGYQSIATPNHESISKVLQQSFCSVKDLIPEEEKDLGSAINNQIEYFSKLQDQEIIKVEVKKCTDGMRQAQWAKYAPKRLVAYLFVKRFKEEYEKRTTDSKKT